MTPDREQIRRDAERSKDFGVLCGHIETLLSELEQAERERDDWKRIEQNKGLRLLAAEARLAKVPALVESLEKIATQDADFYHGAIAREALTVWEQE